MDVSFDDERHDFNRGNNSNETLTAINGAAAVIFIAYRRGENTSWKILIIEASSNCLTDWIKINLSFSL